MNTLKSQFLLDENIHFLNHGSFGACPRPVFADYQEWQRKLEHEPVRFMEDEVLLALANSRKALSELVGCEANDLVYFPNPTTALNTFIRNMDLYPGDEVLTTNHEYGALDRTWKYYCQRWKARYRRQHIRLPLQSREDFIEQLWAGVNERTRCIFISHITSPTALIFPVAEICRRAREKGIMTIVDGAHVPGHIDLNISELDADVYAGACHKWLCAPKGTSFLWVRPEHQHRVHPLVVSWGWESEQPGESQFLDWHQWQGTRDMSAFLAVPAAIRFQQEHGWDLIRNQCHQWVLDTIQAVQDITGVPPLCPASSTWLGQMGSMAIPVRDPERFRKQLLTDYHIEIPVFQWENHVFIRVSYQGYNDKDDMTILTRAIKRLLP